MLTVRIAAVAALASGFIAVSQRGAEARIQCDGNYQLVHGQPVSALYCQEQELARVARLFGWRISATEIRYSESKKAEVCRAVGFDNRVQQICGPYRSDGPSRYDR